jgi:hypothetical protein
MILSGLWMWKGHVVRRLISKRPAFEICSPYPEAIRGQKESQS